MNTQRVLDPFRFLLIAVSGWMNHRQLQVIEYLREENRVLREQLGARRVRLNDNQRRRYPPTCAPSPQPATMTTSTGCSAIPHEVTADPRSSIMSTTKAGWRSNRCARCEPKFRTHTRGWRAVTHDAMRLRVAAPLRSSLARKESLPPAPPYALRDPTLPVRSPPRIPHPSRTDAAFHRSRGRRSWPR